MFQTRENLRLRDTSKALGIFDLVAFKVILESSSALVSKLLIARKQLVRDQNRLKFGTPTFIETAIF